jgi:hypothetical protein
MGRRFAHAAGAPRVFDQEETMPHNDSDHPRHHRGDPPQHTAEPYTKVEAWQHVLDAMREAGAQAGADAADWWAQDTLGGRARGDVTGRARTILAGIDDGDPQILDALPALDLSSQWADAPTEAKLYTDAVPSGAPEWDALDAEHRDEAIDAFRDGFDGAVRDRVVEHCHTVLPDDTGDGPGGRDPGRRTI